MTRGIEAALKATDRPGMFVLIFAEEETGSGKYTSGLMTNVSPEDVTAILKAANMSNVDGSDFREVAGRYDG